MKFENYTLQDLKSCRVFYCLQPSNLVTDTSFFRRCKPFFSSGFAAFLDHYKAKAEKIRQETEQEKEDWEKVQTDKDRGQDSYEFYRKLEKDTKERYEMYDSWCQERKNLMRDILKSVVCLRGKQISLRGR